MSRYVAPSRRFASRDIRREEAEKEVGHNDDSLGDDLPQRAPAPSSGRFASQDIRLEPGYNDYLASQGNVLDQQSSASSSNHFAFPEAHFIQGPNDMTYTHNGYNQETQARMGSNGGMTGGETTPQAAPTWQPRSDAYKTWSVEEIHAYYWPMPKEEIKHGEKDPEHRKEQKKAGRHTPDEHSISQDAHEKSESTKKEESADAQAGAEAGGVADSAGVTKVDNAAADTEDSSDHPKHMHQQRSGKHRNPDPSTLNASPDHPNKLVYVVVFYGSNPRWESEGKIFVKSKLEILPRDMANDGSKTAATIPDTTTVTADTVDGSQDDKPKKVAHAAIESPDNVAVYTQTARARDSAPSLLFTGYFALTSLTFCKPHSPELTEMMIQKWEPQIDRYGRVTSKHTREGKAWEESLQHEWAVLELTKIGEGGEEMQWSDGSVHVLPDIPKIEKLPGRDDAVTGGRGGFFGGAGRWGGRGNGGRGQNNHARGRGRPGYGAGGDRSNFWNKESYGSRGRGAGRGFNGRDGPRGYNNNRQGEEKIPSINTETPNKSLWVGPLRAPQVDLQSFASQQSTSGDVRSAGSGGSELSPREVEKRLLTKFGTYGKIDSVRVVGHKNCAFVNFESLEDAAKARAAEDHKDLLGFGTMRVGFGLAKRGDIRNGNGPPASDGEKSVNEILTVMRYGPEAEAGGEGEVAIDGDKTKAGEQEEG